MDDERSSQLDVSSRIRPRANLVGHWTQSPVPHTIKKYMIYIKLNKKLDLSTYKDFNNLSIAGLDFGDEIRTLYPGLSINNSNKFIDNYYKYHTTDMLSVQDQLNKRIEVKTTQFFKILENIFGKDYSNQNYIGYLSIFNCSPRFLSDNSFQVYYKHDIERIFETVFHELSHFIFFDYCKHYVREAEKLNCNNGPLWELSEIINYLILNSDEYQQVLPSKHDLCYPELENKLKDIEKIWRKDLPIQQFVVESLAFLSA